MGAKKSVSKIAAAAATSSVVWPEFVEQNGNLFLAGHTPRHRSKAGARPVDGLDNTGREAFHNHLHVLEVFGGSRDVWDGRRNRFRRSHADFRAADRVGRTLAAAWFAKLRRDFPDQPFRVYYSSQDDPTVRFHRVYSDEPVWLDETGRVENRDLVVYDSPTAR